MYGVFSKMKNRKKKIHDTVHCKSNCLETDFQPMQFSYLLIADQYFVD